MVGVAWEVSVMKAEMEKVSKKGRKRACNGDNEVSKNGREQKKNINLS